MAEPITFRNVPGASAPNFGSELFAAQRASDSPNLFELFGELAQDEVNTQRQLDTDAFVAKLNSFRDQDPGDGSGIITADAQRQQFLGEQLAANSFIDAGKASQAVTTNRAQDFLKNAEGRAVSAETRAEKSHEDNLLTSEANRNRNELLNKVTEGTIKQNAQDLKQDALDNDATNKTNAEIQRKRQVAINNDNLQSTKFDIPFIDPATDSVETFRKLRSDLRAQIRSKPEFNQESGISYDQVTQKINNILKENRLTDRENTVNSFAQKTPGGKQEFRDKESQILRDSRFAETTRNFRKAFDNVPLPQESTDQKENIANIKEYNKKRQEVFATYDKEFRKADRPANQQAEHARLQREAMNSFVLDVSKYPITKKLSNEISTADIKDFEAKAAFQIRKPGNFPGATPAEVIELTRIAAENVGGGFNTRLINAKSDLNYIAQADEISAKARLKKSTAPIVEDANAFEAFQKEIKTTDYTGLNTSQIAKSLYDSLKANSADDDNTVVTSREVKEAVVMLENSLRRVSPDASEGELSSLLNRFIKNSVDSAEDSIFSILGLGSGGDPVVIDSDGKRYELENISDEHIDKIMKTWKAKVSAERGIFTPGELNTELSNINKDIDTEEKRLSFVKSRDFLFKPTELLDETKLKELKARKQQLENQLKELRSKKVITR